MKALHRNIPERRVGNSSRPYLLLPSAVFLRAEPQVIFRAYVTKGKRTPTIYTKLIS
jgi:hypothetical protein